MIDYILCASKNLLTRLYGTMKLPRIEQLRDGNIRWVLSSPRLVREVLSELVATYPTEALFLRRRGASIEIVLAVIKDIDHCAGKKQSSIRELYIECLRTRKDDAAEIMKEEVEGGIGKQVVSSSLMAFNRQHVWKQSN